jgi:hypothetical protein
MTLIAQIGCDCRGPKRRGNLVAKPACRVKCVGDTRLGGVMLPRDSFGKPRQLVGFA